MTDLLLDINDLTVSLPGRSGDVPIIRGVDLHIAPGEIVGIAGESGSGKSLTAQTLLGLLPDGAKVGGSVTFAGRELIGNDAKAWRAVRGSGISMVFQDSSSALHPMLTVGLQLTEHMRAVLGLDRRAARLRAIELLDQVRIPHPEKALKSYPHQFSGGMRQRIAIAIALACKPKLLIADEPTTGLDVDGRRDLWAGVRAFHADGGTVLLTSHYLEEVEALDWARRRLFPVTQGRRPDRAGHPVPASGATWGGPSERSDVGVPSERGQGEVVSPRHR